MSLPSEGAGSSPVEHEPAGSTPAQLRLLVHGATGRLGKAIVEVAQSQGDLAIKGATRQDPVDKLIGSADVVIDVTAPAATITVARLCSESQTPLVVGTTGHNQEQIETLRLVSQKCPVLLAPNFSLGVNLLFWMAETAAAKLGKDFDVEIVELHHRLKKDAPSGTAKRVAELIAAARQSSYEKNTRHGREGLVGERPADEIGVHAVRGGDIIGEHTVLFAGLGERIELTHKASSRETFARGAIQAARWIVGRTPGLYEMRDVLGLKEGARS
ncbi:MAG: 4-hydroxy-tetrahydrodipicolinate reductase [Verrucomicrobia bacterium]|nr:4-hydroxy-tetrahydrodipicolinate reductase [Verrucomicrobiota bacterium]